jgi:hypothetical protein
VRKVTPVASIGVVVLCSEELPLLLGNGMSQPLWHVHGEHGVIKAAERTERTMTDHTWLASKLTIL